MTMTEAVVLAALLMASLALLWWLTRRERRH